MIERMGLVPSASRLTPEEYLELDRNSEFPHEYVDGVVIEMMGGSLEHSQILLNTAAALNAELRERGCRASTNVRVWIPQARSFCYPDIFVVCGAPRFKGDRADVVENPSLIIEVCSEATRWVDHDQKFRQYRSIPELKQYALVSQHEPFVEVFTRTEQGFWLLRDYAGLDQVIDLGSVGIQLPMQTFYRDVEFASS